VYLFHRRMAPVMMNLRRVRRSVQPWFIIHPSVHAGPTRDTTMGLSYQRFLFAMDDTLYRMANTAFERMLQDSNHCRLPQFAGQRIRTVEVVVELAGRKPVAVVRSAFSVLAFDNIGCVDTSRLRRQEYARIENALAPVFSEPERDEKVFDAGVQFVAQGGTWTPSVRAIHDAALQRQRCPRLQARGGSA